MQFFGIEEGLSHREVYCTYEDRDGFIWLGTKYGLNRFDGYDFKLFTKEHNGLTSNEIHQIFQDGEGWLWLLTYVNSDRLTQVKNLSLINPKTGEIQTVESRFGKDVPFKPSDLYHTTQSKNGKSVFLGTKDGKLYIYQKGKKFKKLGKKEWHYMYPWLSSSPKTILVESFMSEVSSRMYEITYDGEIINSWNGFDFFIQGIDTSNNVLGYYKKEINESNFLLDFASLKPQTSPAPYQLSADLASLKCDDWSCKVYFRKNDHTFWYKSEYRFFVFHPQKGILFDFNREYPDISKNVIQDIYFDKSGQAWVATSQGFYIIRLKKNPFRRFLYNPSRSYDINKFISCRGITRTENTLWLSTEEQGNYKIDLQTFQSALLPEFEVLNDQKEIVGIDGRLPFVKENDHLIFGYVPMVHYQISDDTYQPTYWVEGNSHGIWSLYKDLNETIWVGTGNGPLAFYKSEIDSIQVFTQWNDFELPLGGYIYTFLEIDKNNLLIGTSFGIYLLNHQKGIINRYWTGGKEETYFPHDNIFHLAKDKGDDAVIWVATGGGGLIRWTVNGGRSTANLEQDETVHNPPSTVHRQFTIADGLSNNTIYAVYEDENGNLWMSSDYGIIQFNKYTRFTKAFLKKDGITYNEFNRISHHQDEEGNLYFGGLNGITAFHPKDFAGGADTLDIPLRITAFQQYSSATNRIEDRTSEILINPKITLQPGDRFFNIKFALLEYEKSSRTRYAYKIEGQDKNWNVISDNSLRISGLDYGNFILKIKGQGSNGQFSKQELSIPIQVLKPFYLKTWFIVLSLLSFLALIISWYKTRTTQYKRQQALLEKMVRERTETIEKQKEELQNLDKVKSRFFANVSHELRTPLTLMLGPLSTVLKSNKLDNRNFTLTKLVQKNTQGLLRLVNEILDLTKMESGKLNLEEEAVAIYPFTQRLIAAFESHAQRQNINFEFHFLLDKYLQIKLDKGKFEKILNNLLSNALKFTPAGESIIVLLEDLANSVQLKVKDTGRGIHPDDVPHVFNRFYQSTQADSPTEGGTGIGLALSMEFAKLMKGKLWVESTLDKGSTFYFEFPKKQVLGANEVMPSRKEMGSGQEGVASKEKKEDYKPGFEAIPSSLSALAALAPPTLLVVEDNHALRDYIQLILSDKYEIMTAENGQVAWEYLTVDGGGSTVDGKDIAPPDREPSTVHCTPDLILSDIMMPYMDGYQLLEKLKNDNHFRHIPVIMLTARAEMQDKLKALRIGVDDYMLKPFEEEELFARIENLLRNSRERQLVENCPNSEKQPATRNPQLQGNKPNPEDLQWLEDLEKIVKEELSNFSFNVQNLNQKMAMSKSGMERKIKTLTGLTPSKYIQEVRFTQARQLLENRTESSVKAVALSVGLKDIVHFSRQFKARFGKLPSSYL